MRNEVAVRTGFEPVIGYSPIHAFQACSFSHSDTSPLEFPGVLLQPLGHLTAGMRG